MAIHRLVGYLPGDVALYPKLTGRQHLDRFAAIRDMRDGGCCDQLAERFNAELDRPVHTLSKGDRQKIGVGAVGSRSGLWCGNRPASDLPLCGATGGRLHVIDAVAATACLIGSAYGVVSRIVARCGLSPGSLPPSEQIVFPNGCSGSALIGGALGRGCTVPVGVSFDFRKESVRSAQDRFPSVAGIRC